ncbi:MAG: hypothetical protein K0U84_13410 [Actinomycetia bacterium]|nr:hypothetical protein [Actinomycetes bacterium]
MATPKQVWVADTPDQKEFETRAQAEAYEAATRERDRIAEFLKTAGALSASRFSELSALLLAWEQWRFENPGQ